MAAPTTSTLSTPMDDLLRTLDAQCEDYQAIYREGVAQRDCLCGDDLPGLNAATGRMQALMDRVRRRHASLPADLARLEREQPAVAERTESLRRTIRSVLDLREQSESAARRLLEDTRQQLHRVVGTGRRAARGYRSHQGVADARFVDNLR